MFFRWLEQLVHCVLNLCNQIWPCEFFVLHARVLFVCDPGSNLDVWRIFSWAGGSESFHFWDRHKSLVCPQSTVCELALAHTFAFLDGVHSFVTINEALIEPSRLRVSWLQRWAIPCSACTFDFFVEIRFLLRGFRFLLLVCRPGVMIKQIPCTVHLVDLLVCAVNFFVVAWLSWNKETLTWFAWTFENWHNWCRLVD
jgi:hypothetical protein